MIHPKMKCSLNDHLFVRMEQTKYWYILRCIRCGKLKGGIKRVERAQVKQVG